ncbi:hypothetical protein [Anaeromyxobacter oryzae]|uniref:Uncharacterized protein n=1 Tax=Anaeromyxobacter oryzae TaxID=2918170 RepID=A0ABM7WST8_9BACT|nr:hypothetical protein [Anaeromyxobacter oryzae]BDG02536.1 hypothetical protein AMOR_15320 [Anaeromyxobacter oryzae]
MKALSLGELRELLQSAAFAAWWTDHARAVSALVDARLRHDELVAQSELMDLRSELAQRAAIDTFSAAGGAEDDAAKTGVAAQALENAALELVGRYEEQRLRTSDLWVRLGGTERALDERREAAAAASRDAERSRTHAEAALRAAERQHAALRDAYGVEDGKRTRLWDEIEAIWGRSFERALVVAEQAAHARKVRRSAERLFEEAEERRRRARQLRGEAEAAGRAVAEAEAGRRSLLDRASAELGCLAGESFLYFRHRDDKRTAYAVALADDPDGAVQVKALGIYAVGRRGVAALEPAREAPPVPAAGGGGGEPLENHSPGARQAKAGDGPASPPAPAKP